VLFFFFLFAAKGRKLTIASVLVEDAKNIE
jgi:hypothetical protein